MPRVLDIYKKYAISAVSALPFSRQYKTNGIFYAASLDIYKKICYNENI